MNEKRQGNQENKNEFKNKSTKPKIKAEINLNST